MRSPVASLLADLAAGLESLGVAWYLFGARAAILHGVARLTADVDVTVRLPAQVSSRSVVDRLVTHHFQPRITEPDFIERTRVLPLLHTPSSLPLDIVIAGPGLEDRFFDRAITRLVEDVRVPVASAEDIIIMKVLAGRPKDIEDIVAIAAGYGDALGVDDVRQTLGAVEAALGQSDLKPVFEAALARARRH